MEEGANDMLTLLLFHSFGWLHWLSRRVSGYLASGWVVKAPNWAGKVEHGSIHWLSQNQSPVTRPSTVWADYTGIYSAECTVCRALGRCNWAFTSYWKTLSHNFITNGWLVSRCERLDAVWSGDVRWLTKCGITRRRKNECWVVVLKTQHFLKKLWKTLCRRIWPFWGEVDVQ